MGCAAVGLPTQCNGLVFLGSPLQCEASGLPSTIPWTFEQRPGNALAAPLAAPANSNWLARPDAARGRGGAGRAIGAADRPHARRGGNCTLPGSRDLADAGLVVLGRLGLPSWRVACAALLPWLTLNLCPGAARAAPYQAISDILGASIPLDWRTPDPQDLLYMELPAGRVIIELAPDFAPRHVANVRALVRERYFDGLSINRVQDNYVVQWGDPEEKNRRPVLQAQTHLPAEFSRPSHSLAFDVLPEKDVYAPEVGFSRGFPAARDRAQDRAWLAHCYAMVGAARDVDADSGGGTELYAIIGHAPRQLDRNVTLLGRVLRGIEYLSSLPRGTGEKGFYESPAQRLPIRSVRVAADLDPAQRTDLEVLRTDTLTCCAGRRVASQPARRVDQGARGAHRVVQRAMPVRLKP